MSENRRKWSLFPKTLASCVEPLTRPVMKAKGLAGSRILSEWPSIVGPELAARAYPEKLSFPRGGKNNGTLTVAVENGFALELQHMQPIILERLAGYFGYRAVDRLAISHGFTPAAPPKKTPKPKKSALPDEAAMAVDQVEDSELKAALKSLAKTLSGNST